MEVGINLKISRRLKKLILGETRKTKGSFKKHIMLKCKKEWSKRGLNGRQKIKKTKNSSKRWLKKWQIRVLAERKSINNYKKRRKKLSKQVKSR